MKGLRLRPATVDDARQLWVWCNDGAVRTNAFSARPISWGEHVAWLERTLAAPHSRVWIAEREGTPFGQFRVDGTGERGRIDYSIAKDHRGRGLAVPVLRLGTGLACSELAVAMVDGIVKDSNLQSCRAFERAGFVLAAHLEEFGFACRLYEWHCGK